MSGASIIRDSKLNADIAPNANFDGPSVRCPDNPGKELPTDNDGNPIFENGGLPPIEDNTPPAIDPAAVASETDSDNRIPPEDDLNFA